jgi:hypothetical protein
MYTLTALGRVVERILLTAAYEGVANYLKLRAIDSIAENDLPDKERLIAIESLLSDEIIKKAFRK